MLVMPCFSCSRRQLHYFQGMHFLPIAFLYCVLSDHIRIHDCQRDDQRLFPNVVQFELVDVKILLEHS